MARLNVKRMVEQVETFDVSFPLFLSRKDADDDWVRDEFYAVQDDGTYIKIIKRTSRWNAVGFEIENGYMPVQDCLGPHMARCTTIDYLSFNAVQNEMKEMVDAAKAKKPRAGRVVTPEPDPE